MLRPSVPALALLVLVACRGSDPQPLEFIQGDDFSGWNAVVAGGGSSDFVGYTRWDGLGNWDIRLLRHLASSPDELEFLGDVRLDLAWNANSPRLFVSDTFAAVCCGTGITLIDLTAPSLTRRTISAGVEPDALAVNGRWLLTGSASTLTLVDLDGTSSPSSFATASPVTGMVSTAGSFLAFTKGGHVHVTPDATAPAFDEVDDMEVRNFQGAFADGTEAIVAGPAATLGRSRVVRLDLSSPGSPVVLRSHEVDGTFADFAWDGGSTSVVAVADERYMYGQGYVVREEGGTFRSFGIPLPPPSWGTGGSITAHADRLFALSNTGFGFYRIR